MRQRMNKDEYHKYLRSPEWKAKRAQVLKRADRRCEKCGNGGVVLHVHHLTYARIGNEHLDDLKCLCVGCHRVSHGMKRKRRKKRMGTFKRRRTRKARYEKLFQPWLKSDRVSMRKLGIKIPAPYCDWD